MFDVLSMLNLTAREPRIDPPQAELSNNVNQLGAIKGLRRDSGGFQTRRIISQFIQTAGRIKFAAMDERERNAELATMFAMNNEQAETAQVDPKEATAELAATIAKAVGAEVKKVLTANK